MCIIVSKEKGVKLPSKETLKTCFNNNSDGAGLMYCVNNRVYIVKGLMTFKEFKKALNKVRKEVKDITNINLVMHFRIGTKGKNDGATTHPFPITNNIHKLKTLQMSCDMAMVHNGIMYDYSKDSDDLSDTQHFVKEFVYGLKVLNQNFLAYNQIKDMLKKECENTKLVFLESNDRLTYIGDFIEKDGVKYSNSTYIDYSKWDYGLWNYNKKDSYSYLDYIYDKGEKKDEIQKDIEFFKKKKDLFRLNNNYNIFSYTYSMQYECDNMLCLSKDGVLYDITGETETEYICKAVDYDFDLYDKEFNLINIKDLKIGGVE